MPTQWKIANHRVSSVAIALISFVYFALTANGQEPVASQAAAAQAGSPVANPESPGSTSSPNAAPAVVAETAEQKALRLAAAGRQISIALEHKISALIARHIPVQEFQLTVSAEVPETLEDELPYFPGTTGLSTLSSASGAKSSPKNVKVTVFLGQRFGKETTESLDKILKNKLIEIDQKELLIVFEKMTVKTEAADSDIQRRLEKTEADLRAAATSAQSIERERNDIKSELTSSKTNFENLLKDEQEKAKAAEEKAKNLEESKKTLENLAQSGVWILVAVLLGICLIFASKLFAGAIKSVGAGISTIAGSLEALASSLGQKPEDNKAEEKDKSSDEPVGAVGSANGGSSTTATLETLRSRVTELNTELLESINENNENIVLKYLCGLLSHPETIDTAVATMEVLGKEKANQMFYRLGREFQEQIVGFLNHGHYKKNKIELMVDAGEQLLTRLMGENFKASRGTLTPEVSEILLQFSTSDLAEVTNTIDTDHRLRLFFYLEPTRLADLLSIIGKTMPTELEDIGSNLHRISEFEKAVQFDQALIQIMRQRLEANQQDHMEPYMKYYQEVLETMDESMVESLMNKLSKGDERLRKHLKANIVTFNTYFNLTDEFQKELLEGFGNKAVATLIAGVEKTQGEVFLKHIEERRHSLIQEEIDAMESQPKRELRANFDKIKSTLLTRMKVLVKSGALSDAINETITQPANAA